MNGEHASSAADSVERFAADLRELRLNAGDPTLAALSDRTGISKSVISEALSGRKLPTERTVAKLADALDGDRDIWIARRRSLDPRSVVPLATPEEPAPSPRRFSLVQTVLVAALAAVLAIAGTSLFWASRAPQAQAEAETPANAEGPYLAAANGVDPMRTACKDDAIVAADEPRLDHEVHVQLLYSNDCMAVWGRVTRYDGKSYGESLSMTVYPAGDPDSPRSQERSVADLQSMYTTMIVEPDVEARICGIATVTVDGELVELGPPLCA